jgi:hypothetical protein
VSETVKALLGKLAALVPGYAGYADRERRRETDQALRLSVAARLGAVREELEGRVVDALRASDYDRVEPLDALARRVATLADSVRHAPAGYAALFDAATVGAAELDRLLADDHAVREACETLAAAVAGPPTPADAGALKRVEAALADAEAAFRRRGASLREVK